MVQSKMSETYSLDESVSHIGLAQRTYIGILPSSIYVFYLFVNDVSYGTQRAQLQRNVPIKSTGYNQLLSGEADLVGIVVSSTGSDDICFCV